MSNGKPSVVAPTSAGQTHANVLNATKYWINVVVEDEFGDPVAGMKVNFDFLDGNKQGGLTDAMGKISFKDLPNVSCRITLGNNVFYTEKGGAGTLVATRETNVTFGAKDTFSGIARRHSLEDARTIYYYPNNGPLRTKRAVLGLVTVGDTMIVPAAYALEFPVKPSTQAYELRLVVPAMIDITFLDELFAPSVEKLDLHYDIATVGKQTVTLEVSSPLYHDGPILSTEIAASGKVDGSHTIAWDGKANCTKGDLVDRFIHPLFSRYTVKLFVNAMSAKHTDEGKFKVLYHSIELSFAPHTPDETAPPTSQKEKYAQYRLNELGYDGGPVNGTLGAVAKNAIRRFQRAHYKSGTQTLLAENGAVDDDTLAALQAASAVARWEAGKTPLTQDAKLYVDDNFFNDRGADMVTAPTTPPEFGSQNRKRFAEDKMERPFIPLEVTIKLVNKANGGVLAPKAVGPAPIAWEADDGAEDATVISSTTNALAFAFVQNARTNGFSGTTAINQTGDNAPKALNGFRESTPAANVKAWFPDDANSKLDPYKVRAYGTETRGGTTFHRALVDAYFHATDNPKRVGKAGVYFRHSFKGGDDAKLRVALTFEGLSNKTDLVNDHQAVAANLVKETGRWTIWRRAKMNAYCQQAPPTRTSGTPTWATITAWWSEAFIEMEGGGAPAQTLTYTTLVTDAVYKAAILAIPAGLRPPTVTNAASLTYRPQSVYGGPTITQHPLETAQAFITRAEAAMLAWTKNPINALLKVIHDEVRKTVPEGLIIFDFRIHDPITGQLWDPTLNSGHGGFKADPNPAVQNQIANTAGYVRLDGAVTMNVDNPFNVDCYVLHECGHARFLYHHKTNGGTVASDNPTHHDPAQDRCTMSYGIQPDTPNQWRYPFCGKCILKLRGWKVP